MNENGMLLLREAELHGLKAFARAEGALCPEDELTRRLCDRAEELYLLGVEISAHPKLLVRSAQAS